MATPPTNTKQQPQPIGEPIASQRRISDSELRSTVGDSFNIYQATIAICTIFMGFVFAALLQLLSSDAPLSTLQAWTARLLVFAKLSFLVALLCFHFTANQVVRYWQIFFPSSFARRFGALVLQFGIVCMLLSTAVLLWDNHLYVVSIIEAVIGLGLMPFTFAIGGIHKGAPYVRMVDGKDEQIDLNT